MKFGVSSYSYARLLESGDFTFKNAIDHAAKTGFETIEFLPAGISDAENPKEKAREIKSWCKDAGIELVAYTVHADLLSGSDCNLDAEVKRLYGELEIASDLGASLMRHDITWGFKPDYVGVRTLNVILPRLVEGCLAVTEYAKKLGIATMSENHGLFMQDSERILKVIGAVNHPNFGALCDMGNFLCADEDPAKAVGNVAAVAKHVHVKDMFVKSGMLPNPGEGWFRSRGGNYLRCTIAGHGNVPIVQCLNILKDVGYQGCVNLEFEGIEDVLKSIEISYKNVRNYMS